MGMPMKRYFLLVCHKKGLHDCVACVAVLTVGQRQGIAAFQGLSVPSPSSGIRCRSSTTRSRA